MPLNNVLSSQDQISPAELAALQFVGEALMNEYSISNNIFNSSSSNSIGSTSSYTWTVGDATRGSSRYLWLGNLNPRLSRAFLTAYIVRFGPVENVIAFPGSAYAFINFFQVEDAVKAATTLDGKEERPLTLPGQVLSVRYRTVSRPNSHSPVGSQLPTQGQSMFGSDILKSVDPQRGNIYSPLSLKGLSGSFVDLRSLEEPSVFPTSFSHGNLSSLEHSAILYGLQNDFYNRGANHFMQQTLDLQQLKQQSQKLQQQLQDSRAFQRPRNQHDHFRQPHMAGEICNGNEFEVADMQGHVGNSYTVGFSPANSISFSSDGQRSSSRAFHERDSSTGDNDGDALAMSRDFHGDLSVLRPVGSMPGSISATTSSGAGNVNSFPRADGGSGTPQNVISSSPLPFSSAVTLNGGNIPSMLETPCGSSGTAGLPTSVEDLANQLQALQCADCNSTGEGRPPSAGDAQDNLPRLESLLSQGGALGVNELPDGKPSRHLWLGNIPLKPNKLAIEILFSRYGQLEFVRVFPGKTFAFVNFMTATSAVAAKKALDGMPVPNVSGSKPMLIRYQKDTSTVPSNFGLSVNGGKTMSRPSSSGNLAALTSAAAGSAGGAGLAQLLAADDLPPEPAVNLSNKLNPNNVHYDRELANRYKRMTKQEKEALWAQDRAMQAFGAPTSTPLLDSTAAAAAHFMAQTNHLQHSPLGGFSDSFMPRVMSTGALDAYASSVDSRPLSSHSNLFRVNTTQNLLGMANSSCARDTVASQASVAAAAQAMFQQQFQASVLQQQLHGAAAAAAAAATGSSTAATNALINNLALNSAAANLLQQLNSPGNQVPTGFNGLNTQAKLDWGASSFSSLPSRTSAVAAAATAAAVAAANANSLSGNNGSNTQSGLLSAGNSGLTANLSANDLSSLAAALSNGLGGDQSQQSPTTQHSSGLSRLSRPSSSLNLLQMHQSMHQQGHQTSGLQNSTGLGMSVGVGIGAGVNGCAPNVSQLPYKQMPHSYLCPITRQLMMDPVVAADGITYDRVAMADWLRNHDSSPVTRQHLANKMLTPNVAVRNAIATELGISL